MLRRSLEKSGCTPAATRSRGVSVDVRCRVSGDGTPPGHPALPADAKRRTRWAMLSSRDTAGRETVAANPESQWPCTHATEVWPSHSRFEVNLSRNDSATVYDPKCSSYNHLWFCKQRPSLILRVYERDCDRAVVTERLWSRLWSRDRDRSRRLWHDRDDIYACPLSNWSLMSTTTNWYLYPRANSFASHILNTLVSAYSCPNSCEFNNLWRYICVNNVDHKLTPLTAGQFIRSAQVIYIGVFIFMPELNNLWQFIEVNNVENIFNREPIHSLRIGKIPRCLYLRDQIIWEPPKHVIHP